MKKTTTRIKKRIRPYCSFLTMFLLIGTLYLSISAACNIVKYVNYNIKLSQLQEMHNDALNSKKSLIAEIESYKSTKANEAFLRNNLKWAKPDEIPIVIVKTDDKTFQQPRRFYYGY
ncbi:MAG: hypothetical protein K6E29_07115 [Cyanobacteria bacterium RUI128]|nr:hypothetical protein [Cyanobacteria bacterium RUI128]